MILSKLVLISVTKLVLIFDIQLTIAEISCKIPKNALYTEGSLKPSAFYFLGDTTAD
jgi:hypothetical protein